MKVALAALGALSLAACATSSPVTYVEKGYPTGALGVAAIDRGDWAAAEAALLESRGIGETNPARLINLGKVYMETGRPGEALSAWRLALASDGHHEVMTMSGEMVSTRELAQRALAMYDTGVRSAAVSGR